MRKILILLLSISIFSCIFFYKDFDIYMTKKNIKISTETVKQGELFVVEYPKKKDYKIVFKKSQTKLKTFIYNDKKITLIPVHYSTAEGNYPLEIYNKNQLIYKKDIKIVDGNFKKSYITVSNTMKEKRSSSNMKVMTNKTAEAKSNPIKEKLWEGNFIYPMEDKKYHDISSTFGAMRFVNNKVVGYHSGMDFPVPVGTTLKATNNGKVVLAENLTTTGNTIIIDHGLNVYSAYAHMSELSVKVGDTVKKGENIGKSGNTGFTTGPHLHFTISVGTTFVNPRLFINSNIIE